MENVEPDEDVEQDNVSIIEAENNIQPSTQSGWYKDSKFEGVDTKSLFENYFSHFTILANSTKTKSLQELEFKYLLTRQTHR